MDNEVKVKILLVDDHPENLLTLEAVLGDLGQELVAAHSAREALKKLLEGEFAVIILDVQMPEMDGFELAALIRERTRLRQTPIIFLTAINKSDVHVFRGYALGAVDYMFKPFQPEVLRSKVSAFVDLFKKTRELERQLAETQRLNRELDERNRAITRLNEDISQLMGAEQQLRAEVMEWQQAQEEVLQAKEKADRDSQYKSEFLANVSHELRTPLTAILGFAGLLGKSDLNTKQTRYVESISKAGRHLLDLINEVLDITRVEVDALAIKLEPVSVDQALDVSRSLIRPLAAHRQVRVIDEVGDMGAGYVMADAGRLKQVLLNLISNAVKYNVDGGSVYIGCEQRGADRLRITVRDTGPGIPAGRMDRLFAPFDRLGAEETTVEGTGLGLALSRRLVEAMGGVIGVDSVVGEGSTFWVELPCATPNLLSTTASQSRPPAPPP